MNAQLVVNVHEWELKTKKTTYSIQSPWTRNGSWCILLLKRPIVIDQYVANKEYYHNIAVLTGTLIEYTQLYDSPVQYLIKMTVHPQKTFGNHGLIDLEKYYEQAPVIYQQSISSFIEKLRTPFQISHTLLVDNTLTKYKPT